MHIEVLVGDRMHIELNRRSSGVFDFKNGGSVQIYSVLEPKSWELRQK